MTLKQRLKTLLRKFDRYSPRPLYYSFIMSEKEIALFDKTIKEAKVYLEFGMGGSTFRACLSRGPRYIPSIRAWSGWPPCAGIF
jgi:hypothetical protein